MQIRKVRREDLIEVAKIKVMVWQETYKKIISQEFLKNMDYKRTAEKWNKNFNDENFIVAIEEKKIVGFCRYGNRIDELDRFKEYDGEIYAIYIEKDYTKKGIGKEIIKYATDDLKRQNKSKIIIWCLEKNTESRQFYTRIGGKMLGKKQALIGNDIYTEVAYGYNI